MFFRKTRLFGVFLCVFSKAFLEFYKNRSFFIKNYIFLANCKGAPPYFIKYVHLGVLKNKFIKM